MSGRPRPQPGADLGRQFGTDDAVVATAALTDVVQQRAPSTNRSGGTPGGETACPRDGFDEMAVDGPDVDHIAWRQVTHRAPLGKQPAPQAGPVEASTVVTAVGPAASNTSRSLARPQRPLGATRAPDSASRLSASSPTSASRWSPRPQPPAGSARDHAPGRASRASITATGLDHTFVERSAAGRRRAESPRAAAHCRRAQASVDVVPDRAGGVGQDPARPNRSPMRSAAPISSANCASKWSRPRWRSGSSVRTFSSARWHRRANRSATRFRNGWDRRRPAARWPAR